MVVFPALLSEALKLWRTYIPAAAVKVTPHFVAAHRRACFIYAHGSKPKVVSHPLFFLVCAPPTLLLYLVPGEHREEAKKVYFVPLWT